MITESKAKKVLTHHENPFPTHWDVNPYRGCSMGCKYCFAQYTHSYIGKDNFFGDIVVKTNVADCLTHDLKSMGTEKHQIKIGGATDVYQHAESRYELMPGLLNVIEKHSIPVFIQTKSTLILRDIEKISKIAENTTIDIATSVTTLNENIRKIIEPGSPSGKERIEMLGSFSGKCRKTVLCIMPVIPCLTDTEENLEEIFLLAKKHGVDYVVTSFLSLRGNLKRSFPELIKTNFPDKYKNFIELYDSSNKLPYEYKYHKNNMLHSLYVKYGVSSNYETAGPINLQPTLF